MRNETRLHRLKSIFQGKLYGRREPEGEEYHDSPKRGYGSKENIMALETGECGSPKPTNELFRAAINKVITAKMIAHYSHDEWTLQP